MCFFFHMYIPLRQGQTTNWRQKLYDNRKVFLFAHMLQVSKRSLRNLILYTFLMILIMYIAPGQEQKTPWGQTFDVNRKPLSLRPFDASFKQISLNSDFIHIPKCFFHMYIAPGQGQTTLCAQNLMSTEKPCHFAHLLQVSIYLKSVFIHNFSCF